jgi:hypothetical protein
MRLVRSVCWKWIVKAGFLWPTQQQPTFMTLTIHFHIDIMMFPGCEWSVMSHYRAFASSASIKFIRQVFVSRSFPQSFTHVFENLWQPTFLFQISFEVHWPFSLKEFLSMFQWFYTSNYRSGNRIWWMIQYMHNWCMQSHQLGTKWLGLHWIHLVTWWEMQ